MAQRTKRSLGRSRRGNPSLDGSSKRGLEESKEPRSLYEQIESIARRDARLELGEKRNRIFLMNWWCTYYNRPLKDPLLQQYTLEELAYEYYLIGEIAKYKEELANEEADRIEEEQLQMAEDWADMMEAEEEAERQARLKKKQEKALKEEAPPKPEEVPDPRNDPEQIKWMEEEIKKNKLLFGDDFGEDVSLDFESED